MESVDSRRVSRAAVLGALLDAGTTTRAAVAQRTGLSASTLSRAVDELAGEGLVREVGSAAGAGRGRRAVEIEVSRSAGSVVGVDLGGSTCRVAVGDLGGTPSRVRRAPTPRGKNATALARWLVSLVERTRAEAETDAPLRGIALGLPGVVAPGDQTVRGAVNLPQIDGDAFSQVLMEEYGPLAVLDNDANLAAIGETSAGAAVSLTDVVMFTVGTGLGAGVVVGGQLLRGRTGFAGEFGFLPASDGSPVEDVTSGRGLLARAADRGIDVTDAAELFAPGASKRARVLRDRFLAGLTLVTTAAALAYDPEAVVFGGGMAPAVEGLLSRLRDRVGAVLPDAPDLIMSGLGDDAGLVGALRLATDRARAVLGADPPRAAGADLAPSRGVMHVLAAAP